MAENAWYRQGQTAAHRRPRAALRIIFFTHRSINAARDISRGEYLCRAALPLSLAHKLSRAAIFGAHNAFTRALAAWHRCGASDAHYVGSKQFCSGSFWHLVHSGLEPDILLWLRTSSCSLLSHVCHDNVRLFKIKNCCGVISFRRYLPVVNAGG